jgi:hypothetical protein
MARSRMKFTFLPSNYFVNKIPKCWCLSHMFELGHTSDSTRCLPSIPMTIHQLTDPICFPRVKFYTKARDSSVGTATMPRTRRPKNRVRFTKWTGDFLIFKASGPSLGSKQPPILRLPGIKLSGREADQFVSQGKEFVELNFHPHMPLWPSV